MLEVVRSPAKVCWHIKYNGVTIDTANTKAAAKVIADNVRKIMCGWG